MLPPKICWLLVFLGLFSLQSLAHPNATTDNESGINPVTENSSDIIDDIRSGQYQEADNKILHSGVFAVNITKIVEDIYANKLENFDLLKDYCNASSQIPIVYSVLTELLRLMESNGHMDVNKLMIIYEMLSTKILISEHISEEMKTEANRTCNSVGSKIIANAVKILASALLNGDYDKNATVQEMASGLQSINEQISDDTMNRLIDEVFDSMPTVELIRHVYDKKRISQTATLLVRIYDKFHSVQNFDIPATMLIAHHLKMLKELGEYEKVASEEKKQNIDRVISRLPAAVRILRFASKVCIRNVIYSEYMYSPINKYKLDRHRRHVFTWANTTADSQAQWIIKDYDQFSSHIVSAYNRNEYLYVPMLPPFSERYRHVMTWVHGGNVGQQSAWRIYPVGKKVYILNLHFNEYLCVADPEEKYTDTRRYVFIQKDDTEGPLPECQWVLTSC